MLSPEVWQFPPPKSGSRVRNNVAEENLCKEIQDQSFYHSIFVLCADTKQDIPSQLKEAFDDSSYYKLTNCSISEFLRNEFIEGYIQKGSFSCLSIEKDASIENVVAITSQGGLLLLLTLQSYRSLGIQGKQFRKANGDIGYYININLTDGSFPSQKKFNNHAHTRLENLEPFTFILRWEPHQEQICPSSIAKYFTERGLEVEVCTPRLAMKRQQMSYIPNPDAEHINDLIEWMGMIAIGGDLNPENRFLSTYELDNTNSVDGGFITAYHISGFFTAGFVLQLRHLIREKILDKNICKWIGLTIQRFTDAPTLKGLRENKSGPSEDGVLSILMNEKEIVFNGYKSY